MVINTSVLPTEIIAKIASRLEVPLSDVSLGALASVLERHSLPKGHLLLKEDAVCDRVYFIEKGITRTFYVKDGKEITDCIGSEGGYACAIMSFISRAPDKRMIQLLEPSVLWSIAYEDLQELYARFHEIEHFGRTLAEFCVIELQKRFDGLYFSSALQRYTDLIESTPSLLQRVPLGIIASYLGITQETLSRVRTQL